MTNRFASAHAPSRAQVNSSGRRVEHLRPQPAPSGEVVDQYGRSASECERSAELARVHEAALRAALGDLTTGVVELGMTGGVKQWQRVEAAASLFADVAERDNRFAADLREANGR
jgi:hypothetical protein